MGLFSRKRTPASTPATPSDPSTDPLDRIMPALRTDTAIHLQQLRFQMRAMSPTDIPSRPFAGGLHITLVEDLPGSMAYVDQEKLDSLGLSFENAYERALSNLRASDEDEMALRAAELPGGGSTYAAFGTDDFLGTRLLTFEYFTRVPMPQLIVAINPERNTVILADATSPEAMIQAFDNAQEFATGSGFVSLRPIVGNGSEWLDLDVPEGHPARAAFHALLALDASLQANATGPELQHLVGQDVLVEKVICRSEDGRSDTVTCWREGHQGLIARTDTVAFIRHDESQDVLYAPWDAVMKTVGMLMKNTSLIGPPRWRLAAFPTDEQLAKLGARPLS